VALRNSFVARPIAQPSAQHVANTCARCFDPSSRPAAGNDVPAEWKAELGVGWWLFLALSAVMFLGLTCYAGSQLMYRSAEIKRAARRARTRPVTCSVEYRMLMLGLSCAALGLRTIWHLDPASFEGLLPRPATFLLLRIPQCLLFVQALFVVAFT